MDDLKEGPGTLTYQATGDVFEGVWVKGMRNGKGR